MVKVKKKGNVLDDSKTSKKEGRKGGSFSDYWGIKSHAFRTSSVKMKSKYKETKTIFIYKENYN